MRKQPDTTRGFGASSAKNPLLPRLLAVVVLGLVASTALRGGSCFERPLRVGTFNIRELGPRTDLDRLVAIILATEADVLAVQEVRDESRLRDLRRRLAARGRRFEQVLTRCGGEGKLHLGFLYDADRVDLHRSTEYPELAPEPDDSRRCARERPGLAVKLARAGSPASAFQLLTFHLVMGPDRMAERRTQWRRAHAIAAQLGREAPVAIIGDANSTGFIDDDGGERTFIVGEAEKANMTVLTTDVECTEYFRRGGRQPLVPSHLDHLVATPGFARSGSAKVHGFCAELRCRATNIDPPDFAAVSDHCPVTLDL